MVAGGAGWHRRARMLGTAPALQAPLSSAPARAASSPSSSTAAGTLANCRPPPSRAEGRVRRRPGALGNCQPLKGAPLRSAPGFSVRIGTQCHGSQAIRPRPKLRGCSAAVSPSWRMADPIGIGPHVDRPPGGAGRDAVPVVAEAHQASLGDRCPSGAEAVAVRCQEGPLLPEHLPLARDRRMRMLPGVPDAPIHQPLADLGVAAAPRAGHGQAAADVTHLPLDPGDVPVDVEKLR